MQYKAACVYWYNNMFVMHVHECIMSHFVLEILGGFFVCLFVVVF